jgi:hypothetical protein
MLMKRLCVCAIGIFLLLAPARGEEGKKEVRAVVEEIDAEVGTITVILADAGKSRADRIRTYNLARRDLPVTSGAGKPSRLADLKQEDRVVLNVLGEDVTAIALAPPQLFGPVIKIDPERRTLEIRSKLGERTVTVPTSAKILGPGAELRFEELKPGSLVLVEFAADQKTVLDVRTGKNLQPAAKLIKGTGYLIDIDRERGMTQVLINSAGGDHSLLREVPLARDASYSLLLRGKPFRDLGAEEVSRGQKVFYWIDVATRKLAHLQIEMPILGRRTVKAVDRERGQITIDGIEGERTVKLAPRTRIMAAQGAPASLDAIAQKSVTVGLSPDRTTAEIISIVP